MAEKRDCVAGWCADDDWCEITCAADVLNGKWHPVVVHRLLDGPSGFNALQESIGEVSATVLSGTLDDLDTAASSTGPSSARNRSAWSTR